jgi:hypothetical protein
MQGEKRPRLIELVGSREQRLEQLQKAISEVQEEAEEEVVNL